VNSQQSLLFRDVGSLLEDLPQAHLVELASRESLAGLQNICRRELGGRIVADVVADLFPDFSRARVAEVTRQIGLNAIRNACLKTIASIPGPWQARIRCPDREATAALRAHQGPAILAYWHFGPVNLITLGLRRIDVSAMVITRAAPTHWTTTPELAKMRLTVSEDDPQRSVTALRKSLAHLRRGGKVAVAIDGSLGKRDVLVPFLGRQFAVSRGAAGLARLTGAPIIPCTMQWERGDWSMAIRVFDALPLPPSSREDPEAFERAIMRAAVRCFEGYSRRHPSQFKIDQIAEIADSPKLDSGSGTLIGH
jgi:lauroyl/myristoyl acyltransferase